MANVRVASEPVAEEATAFQTILFTDLESSTALTQRVGDETAQEVLRGHNTAVRGALEANGGREVKHIGDGIMASFPSAGSAIEASLAIQRELEGGELRVRIGIDADAPIAEDDDLFGTAGNSLRASPTARSRARCSSQTSCGLGGVGGVAIAGAMLATAGRPDDALAELDAALDRYRGSARADYAWAAYQYARILAEQGDRDVRTHAERLTDETITLTRELGMPPLLELALELKLRLEHAFDSPVDAR